MSLRSSTRKSKKRRTTRTAVARPARSAEPKVGLLSKKDFQTIYKTFESLVVYESRIAEGDNKEDIAEEDQHLINTLLNSIYEATKIPELFNPKKRKPRAPDHCQVCFIDYDEDVIAVNMENCKHQICCTACFQNYTRIKVRDKEVMPWLICPDEKCKAPISTYNLMEYVGAEDLVDFAHIYLQKTIVRAGNWVECSNKKCDFGFLAQTVTSKRKKSCKACGKRQIVSLKTSTEDLDDGFQKMLKDGTIKLCPTCQHPAMKDYGMCNIMECGKCGVWWNWRTYETGKSYATLKNKSRQRGSLWEPGELQYQLNLQRSDPDAFKELLEKNGIKYDPNFVRGQS